ncbi:MAG: hypothetical protein RIR69_910 [Actinomycetota bacterium]|jgi:hypothetical protein
MLPKTRTGTTGTVSHVKFSLILATAVTALIVGACSSSSASQFENFCELSRQMDAASSGPHGQDPAAITDPERMKEVWASLTGLARQMKDQSPPEIADDVTTMVDSLIAMDTVFRENNYDLTAMARDEQVRSAVDAISMDEKTQAASVRYNEFMEDNCGVSE